MAKELSKEGLLNVVPKFEPQAQFNVKKPLILGFTTLAIFIGGFGYWSVTAELDSAAIAPGDIIVSSQRQAVQHLEGGIVEKLLVQDGDLVEHGQLLVKLSEQQSLASLDSLKGQFVHAAAKESRLISELENLTAIRWVSDLDLVNDSPVRVEAEQVQQRIFDARRSYFNSKVNIVTSGIDGARLELKNVARTKKIEQERLGLIEEEIDSNQRLVAKGFSGKSQLLQLKRMATEVRSEISQLDRQRLSIQKVLDESKARLDELELERVNEIVAELRETKRELVAIREQYRSAKDVQNRTAITAPIAGKIVNMQVFTEQGVIRSGDVLMEIVPQDDALLVEAKVKPQDIDIVAPGLPAQVRLTALESRAMDPFRGTVMTVSADKLSEPNKDDYYLAKIEIDESDLVGYSVTPGMNAEVLILAEPRTPLSYLIKPLTDSFNRAFREQ